jgi:hypothetical protein
MNQILDPPRRLPRQRAEGQNLSGRVGYRRPAHICNAPIFSHGAAAAVRAISRFLYQQSRATMTRSTARPHPSSPSLPHPSGTTTPKAVSEEHVPDAEPDPSAGSLPPGPKLRSAWTLGDSQTLVEGTPQESPLVSLAWIAIPTVLALTVLWFMTR